MKAMTQIARAAAPDAINALGLIVADLVNVFLLDGVLWMTPDVSDKLRLVRDMSDAFRKFVPTQLSMR